MRIAGSVGGEDAAGGCVAVSARRVPGPGAGSARGRRTRVGLPGRRRAAVCLVVAAAVSLAILPAPAVDRFELAVGDLSGPGWQAAGLRASLDLASTQGPVLELEVARLTLPSPFEGVRGARVRCATSRREDGALACPRARLVLRRDGAEALALTVALSLDPERGILAVTASDQALAGGRVGMDLAAGAGRLSLALSLDGVEAAPLAGLAALAGEPAPVAVSAGRVTGRLALALGRETLRLEADLRAQGVAFSDPSGLHAGEGLDAALSLRVSGPPRASEATLTAAVEAGAVYLHPLLLQVTGAPVTLDLAGRRRGERVELSRFTVDDPGVARLQGALALDLAPRPTLTSLDLRLANTPAAGLYHRYLEAFAGAGALAGMSVAGSVAGELAWRASEPSAGTLRLSGLELGEAAGRFALLGLDGVLHWTRGQPPQPSRVGWRALQIGRVGLGSARAELALQGTSVRLLAPFGASLLDGALLLERLEAEGIGTPGQRVEADVSLEPVSLERLSERLAWPPLAGRIEGRVPRLVFAGGRLSVEGVLEMGLFDGRVRVANLSLEDPFGVVPRLRADLEAESLDLGLLTRALSFGSIEGLLEARVSSLVLERWQPVAFDAVLRTPDGDRSRHRISQRAVDNLASLGGANAVLSSTFLRFFSDFSYDRLGLSCRLEGGVCHMGGVERARRGYYIVKGGGLPPRVDVVGFNERVDWQTLVSRLRAVAGAEGPVVR